MKKRIYLIIFVVIQITFYSLPAVVSELNKDSTSYQNIDTDYYWFSNCIIIGSFDKKSIDDSGYISQYIIENTDGIAFGLLRDNEKPEEKTLRLIYIRDMTVSIPIDYHTGYIGDMFLCGISKDCTIR